MKAPDFDYERPRSLDEALALLADSEGRAQPLAGGQSLMPMMNFRMAAPELLIDLNGLPELAFIEEEGEAIRIGAMTRYADLARAPLVAEHLPLLAMALPHVAHPAIRNRGTIGGSVALADPAAELPAVLLALDATIVAVSGSGERRIPAGSFFLGLYETALDETEIVRAILIPKAAPGARFAFREIVRRHGDYAMAGVAVAARSADPFRDLRIALFGIADRALRATEAEAVLEGRGRYDEAAITEAMEAVAALEFASDLNASAAMKRHLAGVVLERALGDLRS